MEKGQYLTKVPKKIIWSLILKSENGKELWQYYTKNDQTNKDIILVLLLHKMAIDKKRETKNSEIGNIADSVQYLNNNKKELIKRMEKHIENTKENPYIDKVLRRIKNGNDSEFLWSIIENTNWDLIEPKKIDQNENIKYIIETIKNKHKFLFPVLEHTRETIRVTKKIEDLNIIWSEAFLKTSENIHLQFNENFLFIDIPLLIWNLKSATEYIFENLDGNVITDFIWSLTKQTLKYYEKHKIKIYKRVPRELKAIIKPEDNLDPRLIDWLLMRELKTSVWSIVIRIDDPDQLLNYSYYKKPLLTEPNSPIFNEIRKNRGEIRYETNYIRENSLIYSKPHGWSNRILYTLDSWHLLTKQIKWRYSVDQTALNITLNHSKEIDEEKWAELNIARNAAAISDMINLENHYFYMMIKNDTRGRQYYEGSISPTDNKLTRPLFYWDNYKTKKETYYMNKFKKEYNITIDEWKKYLINAKLTKIKHGDTIKSIIEKKEIDRKIEDRIWALKLEQTEDTTVELDATSSVLQIMLCLSKNYEMLERLGFTSKDKYIDPYNQLINESTEEIEKFAKYIQLIKKEEMYDLKSIQSIIKNRKNKKMVIMTYLYGSNIYKMSPKIEDHKSFNYIDIYIALSYMVKEIKSKLKWELELLESIADLNIVKIEVDKRPIYISPTPNIEKFRNRYNEIKKVQKEITINKKTMHLSWEETLNTLDTLKTKRATSANLIHYLDAIIMNFIKAEWMKNDKQLITIHDAFIVHFESSLHLLYFYNNCLTGLFQQTLITSQLRSEIQSGNLLGGELTEHQRNKVAKALKSVQQLEKLQEKNKNKKIWGLYNVKP